MEIHLKASKTDSRPFSMPFPCGLKNKGGADAAGSGGRSPLKGVDKLGGSYPQLELF